MISESSVFEFLKQNGIVLNSQLTAEVTALIASQSLSLVEGTRPFPPTALYDFWFHGQEHLKQRRKDFTPLTSENHHTEISEKELEVILTEFFAEEMLIRVATAILTAADKRRNQCQAEPIARNLFLASLEVKRLALIILVSEKFLNLETLKRINRTRRSIERWTDLLLGQLVLRFGLEEFAHDSARSQDFGEDQSTNLNANHPIQIWDLITAGLRISFPVSQSSKMGNQWELMLGAIMACYPSECFNHSSSMKSIHQLRLERSGIHPETTLDRLPDKFSAFLFDSSLEIDIHEPTPLNSSLDKSSKKSHLPLNNQSVSFSKLRKRKSNESSS